MARKLSGVEVAQYAINAGASGRELITLVAISFSENRSHDPEATNTNRNSTVDVGLWQINSSNASPESMKNPAANASKAVELARNPLGFKNWTDYKNGQYALFYGQAATAVAQARQIGTVGGIDVERARQEVKEANPLGALVDATNRVTRWIGTPANIGRVAIVIIGGVLIVGALLQVARPIVQEVGEVVPG